MNAIARSEWLTAEEAAAYFKVKPRSLLLWVRQGKVKGHKLSGTKRHVWRFKVEDLDASLVGSSVALPSVSTAGGRNAINETCGTWVFFPAITGKRTTATPTEQ